MLASFDFAPLARRYAQDERWRRQGVRRWGPYPLRCWKTITRVVLENHIPFHNPVRPERSEAQPSEVEGRKFMAGGLLKLASFDFAPLRGATLRTNGLWTID